MVSNPELLIVDWSGLAHRAFHALGADENTPATDLVDYARELAMNVAQLVLTVGSRVVFVMDGGLSGRREIYEPYKAQRVSKSDRPDNLTLTLSGLDLKRIYRAVTIKAAGFEADDTMAAIAKGWRELFPDTEIFILSNDGDMLQAVDEKVTVIKPRSQSMEELTFVRPDDVVEKYGFGPKFIPDYKALRGDVSDNIPGIEGIGHGWGCKLTAWFGDVENVLAGVMSGDTRVPPNKGTKIIQGREIIRVNKRLTVLVDLPWQGEMTRFVLESPEAIF